MPIELFIAGILIIGAIAMWLVVRLLRRSEPPEENRSQTAKGGPSHYVDDQTLVAYRKPDPE